MNKTDSGPMVEHLREMSRDENQLPPAAKLVGWRWTHVEEGRAVCEMEATAQHSNLMGYLHGGFLCTIADAAMGVAFASTLEQGQAHTTIELKINYLRPVWRGMLTAEGKLVKRGKKVGMMECRIHDAEGNLVGMSTGTFMALRGQDAKGRRIGKEETPA